MKSKDEISKYLLNCSEENEPDKWNQFRTENPELSIDLSGVNLLKANLKEFNLSDIDLSDANLKNAKLQKATLHKADLTRANFTNANIKGADLRETIRTDTNFQMVKLDKKTKM